MAGRGSGELRKNSDNVVQYIGATDIASGQPINDASFEVSLFTQVGTPISGASWPVSGYYIDDSSGDYLAIIQDSIDWTADTVYRLQMVVDGGSDLKLTRIEYLRLIE